MYKYQTEGFKLILSADLYSTSGWSSSSGPTQRRQCEWLQLAARQASEQYISPQPQRTSVAPTLSS